MKIIKVTEDSGQTLPDEHLMFQDIFDSFNAPGIWIYSEENGQKGPYGMIQDGHSAILLYDTNESELKWKSIKEDGAYYVEAEQEGEGGVIIPHLAEFELDIYLDGKRYDIMVKCDASSSDALHIALKSTTPVNFFRELNKRIRDIVTTMYIGGELLEGVLVGQEIPLPENSFQILMKFGMLGLKFEGAKVINISESETPEEIMKEFEVEEAAEESHPNIPSIEEEEEEILEYQETPGGPPAVSSVHSKGIVDTPSSPPKVAPAPKAVPSPSRNKKSAQRSSPPMVKKPEAVSAPSRSKMKSKEKSSLSPPMPAVEQKMKKKSRKLPPMPVAVNKEEIVEDDLDDFMEADELTPAKMATTGGMRADDIGKLMPVSMDKTKQENVLKSVKVKWFDKMVINRTYPVDVTISTGTLRAQKQSTNILSGERETEKVEKAVVDLNRPVLVRAIFPGCITQPSTRLVDPKKDLVSVRFYATPMSKGKMDCRVVLEQDDNVISELLLPSSVITHRASTLISYIAMAVSGVPASIGYISGVPQDLLQPKFLYLYGFSAISGIIGLLAYVLRGRSKSKDKSTALPL